MSNTKLTVLGILAAVMVIAAVVVQSDRRGQSSVSDGPSYLIQGLEPDNIGSIVVGSGEDALTLKRSGRSFVIVNKDNYPAMANRVSGVLTSCLDIETTELVTSDEGNYADLGVTEENAQAIVKFLDAEGKVITGLILGKNKEGAEGGYVRRTDSSDVYFTLSTPWVRNDAVGYMDTTLTELATDDIVSVTVDGDDGNYALVKDAASGDIVLEGMAEGKQFTGTVYKDVFNALKSLSFADVQAGTDGLEFDRSYSCTMKDSTLYKLKIAKKGEDFYVQIGAVYTGGEIGKDMTRVETDEELKAKEQKLLAKESAMKFAAKHQGWVYKLSSSAGQNLVKDIDDIIEDVEELEAEADTPSAPAVDSSSTN